MKSLPIDLALPSILDSLSTNPRLVLGAPPGTGKTTRVPVALLKSGLLDSDSSQILVLQPRRVAARSVASRIAQEQGWSLGEEVGYHIRFEKRISARTRLQVLTEGLLTRKLLNDPFLEGVGAVILDEFHERSLHADLALALVREVANSVRPDLAIIVMSATLDPGPVADFLGNCPIIIAQGRAFLVATEYRVVLRNNWLEAMVAELTREIESVDPSGDILAFLPGVDEIRRVSRRLEEVAKQCGTDLLPLHGTLPPEEQDRALRPSQRRKVILATNIAETSLTIDGVTVVIDSGLAREASFDPARGLDRLELTRISKASADQRAGRAGRTAPGHCIRLWSEREHHALAEADTPEIRRVDLTSTLLTLHSWGQSDPNQFGWFESPTRETLQGAERLLIMLGALSPGSGRITELGQKMASIPAHPRLARLLIAASNWGCRHDGATLAAILSEKDIGTSSPFQATQVRGSSDLFDRLDRLAEAEHARFSHGLRDRGIDPIGAQRVVQLRDELIRLGRRLGNELSTAADESTLLRLIMLAYPDRVVRRRTPGSETGRMVGGRGIRIDRSSQVREAEFFLALDPRDDRGSALPEARVRMASAIDPAWLAEEFPNAIRTERVVEFEPILGKVVGSRRTWYHDLLIREDIHEAVDASEASRVLAEALRPQALGFIRDQEEAARWLDRLELLREAMPELEFPLLSDNQLVDCLEAACQGKRTLEDLKTVNISQFLRGLLSYEQARRLDELAPDLLLVPSGNRIKLTYEHGRPPVLAVRLQELFGCSDTPRIAGGRVAVLLHLLGPNYRPVQITEDLKNFWATTYFQVRKDLRARYPKHSWPDDPLTAKAESRGGRRST